MGETNGEVAGVSEPRGGVSALAGISPFPDDRTVCKLEWSHQILIARMSNH